MKSTGPKNIGHDTGGDHGFTLIELLVVIAIIAILAALLLPSLANAKLTALGVKCMSNSKQITLAAYTYAADSRDYFPLASDDGTGLKNPLNKYCWCFQHEDYNDAAYNYDPYAPDTGGNAGIAYGTFFPYVPSPQVYRCPADNSTVMHQGQLLPRTRSISMNFYLGGFAGGGASEGAVVGHGSGGNWATSFPVYMKFSDLPSKRGFGPSFVWMFLDEREDCINWGNYMTDMSGYYNPATPTAVPFHPGSYQFYEDMPASYHNRASGFGFCDGHAEIHQWKDPRTYPALLPPPTLGPAGNGLAVPNDVDVYWLMDHTVRPNNF